MALRRVSIDGLMEDERTRDPAENRPFAGHTAACYTRYRRQYPRVLIERILKCCSAKDSYLDLGCGTGKLLFQLAGWFRKAVGVDPEPDMLREAAKSVCEQGLSNVEFFLGSSRDLIELADEHGRFDLVTIGTALHHMEPRATLEALKTAAAGGTVAITYAGSPMWLYKEPWSQAVRRALEERFGPLKSNDFTLETLNAAEEWMGELGYTSIERWEHTEVESVSLDFLAGHLLSAISEEQIPFDERDMFATEIKQAVAEFANSGQIVEPVCMRALLGRA